MANRKILEEFGFGEQVARMDCGVCACCATPIREAGFRDEVSRREFKISGLCQECQDSIFGGSDEEN
jgi:hypothetical protein